MDIRTLSIDKDEFMKALSFLSRRKKEQLEQSQDQVMSLLESSHDAYDFLRKADDIEDKIIQNYSRRAVISQMYDAKPHDCYDSNSRNYIDYCRNQIALIQVPREYYVDQNSEIHMCCNSCAIISKYGEVLVDKGVLWINGRGFDRGYVETRKIIDGNLTWTKGIYSDAGQMVLPFGLWDNINLRLPDESTAEYKGLKFSFSIYAKIQDIHTYYLRLMAESADNSLFISPYDVILSCDGRIWRISQQPDGAEFIEKMAPYRVTKEIFQQELDRRERQNNVHRGDAENPIKE